MTLQFLYRGFNSKTSKLEALKPKNPKGSMELGAECGDERVQCGDCDFSFGTSVGNAVHSHEYGRNGEKTGYLSFTPNFEQAKFYALKNGEYEKGTVIKVALEDLCERKFEVFSVNELIEKPAAKEDNEYCVYVGSRTFPEEAIIEEIIVYRD